MFEEIALDLLLITFAIYIIIKIYRQHLDNIFSLCYNRIIQQGEFMIIPHRPKEAGSPDFSEGHMKRFICYCPYCQHKVLYEWEDFKRIVRQLLKHHYCDTRYSLVRILGRGIIQTIASIRYMRFRVVDVREMPTEQHQDIFLS